jgi:hypothetical protein
MAPLGARDPDHRGADVVVSDDRNRLLGVLARVSTDLTIFTANWAPIGGWAVGVRAEPRTTRDVDVVVATGSDRTAEKLVHDLQGAGYRIVPPLRENIALQRLAMVRMNLDGINIDLMFAARGSSGRSSTRPISSNSSRGSPFPSRAGRISSRSRPPRDGRSISET